MKNLKFYIIIILLAIGATWLAIKFYQKEQEVTDLRESKAIQEKAVQKEARELSRKVDSVGIETVLFEVTANKVSREQVKATEGTKTIIDTTAMALDIRNKQLKEILIINSTLVAENLKLKKVIGQNQRPYYTYSGDGLNLKFTPPYNDSDTTDQGTADFNANVNIKATQYWKRNWFLGAKKSVLAVSSNSPLFKINGADFVEFEQSEPKLELRLQAGANYDPQTGSIGFGPAARIDIGRFSVEGNYTWYPESEKWSPSINANFDLVRF